eukprot:Clim_evm28s246 gene=Clim_evmTU28s246
MSGKAKAVLLVGGPTRGTRFRPMSLNMPKALFPVAGLALVEHQIAACKYELTDALVEVLLIGFYPETEFKAFVSQMSTRYGINVHYLYEYEPLGTAGGIYHFRDRILRGGCDYLFVEHMDIACDYPLKAMLDFHKSRPEKEIATMLGVKAMGKIEADNNAYGRCVVNAQTGEIEHYVEKPSTYVSDIINGGIYLFEPKALFQHIKQHMANRHDSLFELDTDPATSDTVDTPSHSDVCHLEKDVLEKLAGTGKLFLWQKPEGTFWSQLKTSGEALDCQAFYLAERYQKGREEEVGTAARTDRKSELPYEVQGSVYVSPSATVAAGAKIGPNVAIGDGTVVEAGARIKDAIILSDCVIKMDAYVVKTVLGDGCVVGRWSRIEGLTPTPQSAGHQFVEGKKAPGPVVVGDHVKIAHEVMVRNCVVLPNKEIKATVRDEILL